MLDPALAGKFRDGWLSGTPAEDLVEDQLIDTFTVAGDLSDCLAGLSRLEAAGLTCAVLRDPGDASIEALFSLTQAHTDAHMPG